MSLADQPAFPRADIAEEKCQIGMTYRQWLVGMALQGSAGVVSSESGAHDLAESASLIADAAIRAQEN